MTQRFSTHQLASSRSCPRRAAANTERLHCSTATEQTQKPPQKPLQTAEPVKMALVLSGSSNDQSWDQAAFDAGEELKAEGIEVAISEAVDPANVAGVLRQYAAEGYRPDCGAFL